MSSEFRHVRSGSLNIPPNPNAMSSITSSTSQAQPRFDGARSPPSELNFYFCLVLLLMSSLFPLLNKLLMFAWTRMNLSYYASYGLD